MTRRHAIIALSGLALLAAVAWRAVPAWGQAAQASAGPTAEDSWSAVRTVGIMATGAMGAVLLFMQVWSRATAPVDKLREEHDRLRRIVLGEKAAARGSGSLPGSSTSRTPCASPTLRPPLSCRP